MPAHLQTWGHHGLGYHGIDGVPIDMESQCCSQICKTCFFIFFTDLCWFTGRCPIFRQLENGLKIASCVPKPFKMQPHATPVSYLRTRPRIKQKSLTRNPGRSQAMHSIAFWRMLCLASSTHAAIILIIEHSSLMNPWSI